MKRKRRVWVWFVVAVPVIAVAVVALIICQNAARHRSDVETCDAHCDRIRDAMVLYYQEHGNAPTDIVQIVKYDATLRSTSCPSSPSTNGLEDDYKFVRMSDYTRHGPSSQGTILLYQGPDVQCKLHDAWAKMSFWERIEFHVLDTLYPDRL